MIYLQYLKAELLRRFGKTFTITFGLAIASAIIITIISASQSLSQAQEKVLNPLENVGTDIMVTRSVGTDETERLDEASRTEMMQENMIQTDLSKLGNPGDSFKNDNFMPGTMLTFATSDLANLDSSSVKEYAQGLILNVLHQEGKIPQITAEFQTGGETVRVEQNIEPLTESERQTIDAARQKAMEDLKAKGIDPNSEEGRQALRDAQNAAMPERFTRFVGEYTTPQRTFRQELGAPQTDITTDNFVVAGVDTSKDTIGLILPNQITEGSYFNGQDQVVVNVAYAQKKNIKVGDQLTLGSKTLTVVGLVSPQLYTNTADLYLPLQDLQDLSGRQDRINVLLVKSTDVYSVEETSSKLGNLFAGAKIIDSSDTAQNVSGSLVNTANLTNRFIGLVSVFVVVAAFIIMSLLTLLSVNKRVREIGTLKAIGWKNSTIVRQIFLENIVLGFWGALVGIGFGLLLIYALNRLHISLSATVQSLDVAQGFIGRFAGGMGRNTAVQSNSDLTTAVNLTITYQYLTLLIGAGVAVAGSVIAGSLAAIKSSKMRPSEALRQL